MLRETRFVDAIETHAPDLLQEVRALALAAGIEVDLLFAAQLMDEEWAYRSKRLSRDDIAEGGKCSSAAIKTSDGVTLIGQNMDLGQYTDGHQLLLRLEPYNQEPGALIYTIGGMLGLMGVNSRQVAVCVNALPQLCAAREGLPVAFIVRRLLQASNAREASRWVRVFPHASPQHYLIADADVIYSYEASAAKVYEFDAANLSAVLHTNHPLVATADVPSPATYLANSMARLKSLQGRLQTGAADLASIQAALSGCDDPNHPVCRVGQDSAVNGGNADLIAFTTGSMVSVLDSRVCIVESWVSRGPPSIRGYTRVRQARQDCREQ